MGSKLLNGSPQLSVRAILLLLLTMLWTFIIEITLGTPVTNSKIHNNAHNSKYVSCLGYLSYYMSLRKSIITAPHISNFMLVITRLNDALHFSYVSRE